MSNATHITPERHVPYVIGIDWGTKSLGFAAIEIDPHTHAPISILDAASRIHDGGAIPGGDNTSRLAARGHQRRARARIAHRRTRLRDLDTYLTAHGYDTNDVNTGDDAWHARARLATEPITYPRERDRLLAIAIRHMARHRGARNAWVRLPAFLRAPYTPSDAMRDLLASARQHNPTLRDDAVQSVCVTAHPGLDQLRVRATAPAPTLGAKTPEPLLAGRFAAADVLHELRTIAHTQGLDTSAGSFLSDVTNLMFAMGDPRAAAAANTGHDPLQPTLLRALRATSAFQEYRILGVLTTMGVKTDDNTVRRLTHAERATLHTTLMDWDDPKPPTWAHIADLLGVPHTALTGISALALDGEPLTSKAPHNTTTHRITTTAPTTIREWWTAASADHRDALAVLLVNSVGSGSDADDAAAALIAGLSGADADALESVRLERDRCEYSADTLRRLSAHMLATGDMPHLARQAVFGTDPTWAPPAPAINEPTRNGVVDRNLMLTQRILDNLTRHYGPPMSVNIEHVRDGFTTLASAKEQADAARFENARREKLNERHAQQVRDARGLGEGAHVSKADVRRIRMIERQNAQCAYCGDPITFEGSELDHIVPRAGQGSTNRDSNFVAACRPCNAAKGRTPFAVWAATSPRGGKVTLDGVIARVDTWTLSNLFTGPYTPAKPGKAGKDGLTPYQRQERTYRRNVIARLKRTSMESADERTLESGAYTARELRRRIHAYYNPDPAQATVTVNVYQGALTAAARDAAGMSGRLLMHGGTGKQRCDRRHHAVDAAVIALMRPEVCTVLSERAKLRADEKATGIRPEAGGSKDYRTWDGHLTSIGNSVRYREWLEHMAALTVLLNDALTGDHVPVTYERRLSPTNRPAHAATVRPYDRHNLADAFTPDDVLRAPNTKTWKALTTQPDYTPDGGLPANPQRRLRIGNQHLDATRGDTINLLPAASDGSAPASLMVPLRHGWAAAGGDAISHARIYQLTKPNGKQVYGMLRVLASDITHTGTNATNTPLPPHCASIRAAAPNVREALTNGTATYIGSLFVGDEIHLNNPDASPATKTIHDTFGTSTWTITGFPEPTRMGMRPTHLSGENLDTELDPKIVKTIATGIRPYTAALFGKCQPTVIRRDNLGRQRPNGNGPERTWTTN